MVTYFTKVKVQADRYIAESGGRSNAERGNVTIVVENEETTEEEFNKRREGLLDGDCSCTELILDSDGSCG